MKKRVFSIILILALFFAQTGVFAHWADPYFEELSKKEIMFGDNGGFRGDDPLLRCEFAAMLNRAFSFKRIKTPSMPDVYIGDWYYEDVYTLSSAGIMNGDDSGMIHPKFPITRAEAAVMIYRVLNYAESVKFENKDTSDIPVWSETAVFTLMNDGIINGYPDGKFHGSDFLLRGEAAVLMKKALDRFGFTEGNGTAENPYVINNERQLASIKNNMSACYILNRDLDFTETEFPLIGSENTPFNGAFDGNGHRIIVSKVADGNNSLFKKISKTAEVKNLYVVCPENRIAIVATNDGKITGCANTTWQGNGRDYSKYFGGIAQINNGEISNCYNLSNVVSFESNYKAGGIAGVNNNLISNCFNGGLTDSLSSGIASENNGIIKDTYTLSGKISKSGKGAVRNCYEGTQVVENFKAEGFVESEGMLVISGMKYFKNEDYVAYGGGDGSKHNPYVIKNGTHFENINKKPDSSFVQMADIDVTSSVKTFGGTYDGNGFSVNSLRLRGNSGESVAMFVENRGEIKNISVKDGLVSGSLSVAGISVLNYGTIYRCGFNGLVTGVSAGGICKSNLEKGRVAQCFFNGRVATDMLAGAIVSENYGTVSDVYSSAEVFGNPAGGIVNYNKGRLEKCYFTGTVNSDFGGIAYENYGNIQSAYTTSDVMVSTDEGVLGFVAIRSEEEFKYPELLMGFDFNFIWQSDGENYPELRYTPSIKSSGTQNLREFAGGTGTVTDPYKIVTPMHLESISLYPDKNFILLGDIDLTEYTAKNPNFSACDVFSGTLDGNGKVIRGFNVTNDNSALFGENLGVIKGLGIENSTMSGENSAPFAVLNSGIIQECYSDVTLKNGGAGIAVSNNGILRRSWSSGQIKGEKGAGITLENTGEISECYSVSDIFADFGIGICETGKLDASWFGGVLYGKNIVPLPQSATDECFYLDYYGHNSTKGVDLAQELDEAFSEKPWTWKDGMPVIEKMESPDISTFRNDGDGSLGNPYVITKAEHLKYLAMYNDKNFVIGKNIDAGGIELLSVNKFSGTIEGNGKQIRNFSIKSEKGGLVGELSGKIKNLKISEFSVEGSDTTGALVSVNSGTIENIISENGRTGTSGIISGGIAGVNKGNGLIINCLNNSDVFSSGISGGVCGDNQGSVVLSANQGGVVATADAVDAMVGGISGKTVGLIDKCYNTGKILSYSESGESIAGGISGTANGSILNCYNTGEITAKAKFSALSGGICGSSDKFVEITNTYNTGFTNATADTVCQGSAAARVKKGKLNCFVYEHTLMHPLGEGDVEENLVFAYPEDMLIREIGFKGFDFENVWSFSYDKYYYFPQLVGNKQDERVAVENHTDFAGGDGTLENPYKIITPEQLDNVRKHLGATFVLIGDIDMASYCRTNEFLPIGDNVFSFFGLFIGNNFTISGLHFAGEDFGLFRENHGEIYNLFFTNSSGEGSGGTIAKFNTGLIYNCVNSGDEKAESLNSNLNRGGIVGINKSTGMIISSYNTGNLEFSGENVQAGGLVYSNYGIVSGSFNSGVVKTNAENLSVAGGIAASNFGVISDCYSSDDASSVSSKTDDSYSGGITGNNTGTVVNCYFSGEGNSEAKICGSIASTNSGTVVNCYHSGEHGIGRNAGTSFDVVSCTEEELIQRETYKDFDFENMWIMDSSFKYKYPQFVEIAHRD